MSENQNTGTKPETSSASERPWMNTSLSPRERAEALVAAMTPEQKANQLGGAMETINIYDLDINDPETQNLHMWRHADAVEELGIPRFNVTNGPVGVGQGDGTPSPAATALPATMGLAATFDRDLAYRYGELAGKESRALGQHLLEAPGMCLARVPVGGRNFEYFSEDPYLSGVMGVEVTKGVQDQGVIAEAKHFVLNDQEKERFRYDSRADEFVMRELYMLPFEMTVKQAAVGCIMAAYQRLNGTYAAESYWLLTHVLREQWGYEGYVQSDFWATRSTAGALNAGLDHEMPDHKWTNKAALDHAIAERILEPATIDRALVRRYTQMFKFGQFDEDRTATGIEVEAGGKFAREAAARVIVLLKNDDVVAGEAGTAAGEGAASNAGAPLLPLDAAGAGRILIVGLDQFANHIANCGGGSSQVIPTYEVAPKPGMEDVIKELGGSASVDVFTVAADLSNLDEAREAARQADTVVVMAGLITTEGEDQEGVDLPFRQNEMLDAVLDANPRTVLVLKDGDPVAMPWRGKVSAILEAFNQGQEDGHAVADVLFGRVNPSAKLPLSYPESWDDTCVAGHEDRYPGVNEGAGYPVMHYSEGLEMGYRWHQAQGIAPMFPFGFGLSYTTFELSDVSVDASGITAGAEAGTLTVHVTVTNTGERQGAEVVQVYAGVPAKHEPPKRLIDFARVELEPGESHQVEIAIPVDSASHPLGVWDANEQSFVVPAGGFRIFVGTSSEDTPFESEVTVK